MMTMILEFINFLRYKGLSIAVSSVNDAIDALKWVDILDQRQVYYALRGSLVKRETDQERFEELFERFFKDRSPIQLDQLDDVTALQLQEFIKGLKNSGDEYNQVIADYLEGNSMRLLEKLNLSAGQQKDEAQEEEEVDQVADQSRKKLLNRITILKDSVVDFAAVSFHLSKDKREMLSDILRKQLQSAADLAEPQSFKKSIQGHLMPWEKQRTISTISFDRLSIKEREIIKDEVTKIAQKLKDAFSRQKRRARRGHIDIKSTLRNSMRFGGIPFNIKLKKNHRNKGKIVVICDISMSVAYAAHLMLRFIYSLQNRFSKIRSFIFVRNTYEISSYFRSYPLELALEKAVKQHHIGLGQLTNYGVAFKTFLDKFSTTLTKETTLIILGDGQNNMVDPKVEYLKEITEKVKRTIWLNPNEEKLWYSTTNVTMKYEPYCDQIFECGTLDQLSEFVKKLVT